MKPSITSSLATLLSFTAAAPVSQSSTNNTSSPFSQPNIIRPSARSQYDVWTGAINYNTPTGKIFKNGQTTDVTTLLTFDYPAATTGLQCEFHFYLDPTATLSGTGAFDVFSSLAPATESTTGWPPGNLRDQDLGRMQAVLPGEAVFLAGYGNEAQLFDCPSMVTVGMELVPTGDVDDIEWVGALAGAYILYHP
jgi:hypothetical protein